MVNLTENRFFFYSAAVNVLYIQQKQSDIHKPKNITREKGYV